MIKIICALVVAIASIFAFVPKVSTTSADTIGTPPMSGLFTDIYNFDIVNRTDDNTTVFSNIRDSYIDTYYYRQDGLSATNGVSYNNRSANMGYDRYGMQHVPGIRPSQYRFNISSTSPSYSKQYYSQVYFNGNYKEFMGTIIMRIPLYYFYDSSDTPSTAVFLDTEVIPGNFYYRNGNNDLVTVSPQSTQYNYYQDELYYILSVTFDTTVVIERFNFWWTTTISYDPSITTENSFFTYYWCDYYAISQATNDYGYGYTTGYDNGFEAGYTAALDNNYNTGYNAGYTAGVTNANNTVNDNSASYEAGYTVGSNEAGSLSNLFSGVLQAPVNVVMSALNFEIFGVNVSTFVLSLLTVGFIAVIFKLLL